MKELSKRFWDAEWHSSKRFEAIDIVTVIGAGGVGSWLTFMLTRAEFKCILFDHDKVEEHNLGGQLFGLDNIGTEKVYATEKLCKESHKGNIMPIPFKYGKEYLTHLSPITVSAVDSMEGRLNIFKDWEKCVEDDEEFKLYSLFVDARLEAEQLQIFCIKGGDYEARNIYKEDYIFPDALIPDSPCTFKQTSHSAAMISSFITSFILNHVSNVIKKEDLRTVPFKTEYFLPIGYFNNVENVQLNLTK